MSLSTSHLIFSVEQWKEHFPAESYRRFSRGDTSQPEEEKEKIKKHALKYFIALESPVQNTLSYISTLKKKHPHLLSIKFGEHQLTPLHIAAMKNSLDVVEKLIESGVAIDEPDAHGWTALHHAALVSQEVYDLLILKGANPSSKTALGGSCTDLRRLAGLEKAIDRPTIFYQQLDKDEVEEINLETLEGRASLKNYSDEVLWPPKNPQYFWDMKPREYSRSIFSLLELWQNILASAYENYKNNPPKLIVKEVSLPGNASSQKKILGITAGEQLNQGMIIVEYSGKLVPDESTLLRMPAFLKDCLKPNPRFEYLLGNIDARKTGNLGRFINDGMPTVISLNLLNQRGRDERPVLITTDESGIAIGEDIFFDYGCGMMYLKWGHYLINNKNKVVDFFRKKTIKEYSNELNTMYENISNKYKLGNINENEMLDSRGLEAKLLYALNTPAVLIYLTCLNITDPKDWLILIRDQAFNNELDFRPHRACLDKLLFILDDFYLILKILQDRTETKHVADEIRSLIVESQDNLSVFQQIKGLTIIIDHFRILLKKGDERPDELEKDYGEKRLVEIRQKIRELASYDWEVDDLFSFPKSFRNLYRNEYNFTFGQS